MEFLMLNKPINTKFLFTIFLFLFCILFIKPVLAESGFLYEPERLFKLENKTISKIEIDAPNWIEKKNLFESILIKQGDLFNRIKIRESVKNLNTFGRFADVVANLKILNNKLILIFSLQPFKRIQRIVFKGNKALDKDHLKRLTRFNEGDEYIPEIAKSRIENLLKQYERNGYRKCKINIRTVDVPLTDKVLLIYVINEGFPTRISKIKIKGQTGIHPELYKSRILSKKNDILNIAKLNEYRKNLLEFLRQSGFLEAIVKKPEILVSKNKLEAEVIFTIWSEQRIKFLFLGNEYFNDNYLFNSIELSEFDNFKKDDLYILEDNLNFFYRTKGFIDVKVKAKTFRDKDRNIKLIIFYIDEGKQFNVRKIRFEGNNEFSSSLLTQQIKGQLISFVKKQKKVKTVESKRLDLLKIIDRQKSNKRTKHHIEIDSEQIFLPEQYAEAVNNIKNIYLSRGYLNIKIKEPKAFKAGNNTLIVNIEIIEGIQTRISSIKFEGNKVFKTSNLKENVLFRVSDPLDRFKVNETRIKLITEYMRSGYIYCDIEEQTKLSKNGKSANIVFKIKEGIIAKFGEIYIRGNRFTKDWVIKDTLAIKTGEIYNPEDVQTSYRRLMELGVFKEVTIRPMHPEQPEEKKDISTVLQERKPQTIETKIGFSNQDGARTGIIYSHKNLWGHILEFRASAIMSYRLFLNPDEKKDTFLQAAARPIFLSLEQYRESYEELTEFDKIERQITAGFHYPKIYGIPFESGARLDLIHDRENEKYFSYDRYASSIGTDIKLFTHRLNFLVQYVLEYTILGDDNITVKTDKDLEYIIKRKPDYVDGLSGSLIPSITLDLRDNPFYPHKGFYASFSSDFSQSFTAGIPDFTKIKGIIAGYIPVYRNTTLALSVSTGGIYKRSTGNIPKYKRFFIGGRSSLRGATENSILPKRVADFIEPYGECTLSNDCENSEVEKNVCLGECVDIIPSACVDGEENCISSSDNEIREELIGDCDKYEVPEIRDQCYRIMLEDTLEGKSPGGLGMLLLKAELRFPFVFGFDGGLFLDAGNIWGKVDEIDFTDLRYSAGFGFRYITPIGPVVLDFGFLLDRNKNLREPLWNLNFSIGVF